MTNEINNPQEGYALIDALFDPDADLRDVVFVSRDGEEIAVLLRRDTYQLLVKDGEQADWDVLQRLQYRNRHRDPEQVDRDVAEAVQEVRRERLDERRKSA